MNGAATLFKPDHPRRIDRYIDYFGGSDLVSKLNKSGDGATGAAH